MSLRSVGIYKVRKVKIRLQKAINNDTRSMDFNNFIERESTSMKHSRKEKQKSPPKSSQRHKTSNKG